MAFTDLRPEVVKQLKTVSDHLLTSGKGILASDESPPLMTARMDALQINSGLEYIKRFRALLFDTPGITSYLNGILMYPETAFEKEGGLSMFHTDCLKRSGILCGAKFDMGKSYLPGTLGERITTAPDTLRETCSRLLDLGFDFAKWRIVIKIGDECPSDLSLTENAASAAKFCTSCQENMLFPVVQVDWSSQEDCDLEFVKTRVSRFLATIFWTMGRHRVYLEGMLLMLKMVVPGKGSQEVLTPEEIAEATFDALQCTVPAAIPGILFCTGDLDEGTVTQCINEMAKYFGQKESPWKFTFCLGRGLHSKALKIWGGIPNGLPSAQKAFLSRLQDNCTALLGKYVDPAKKEEEEKLMQNKKVWRP